VGKYANFSWAVTRFTEAETTYVNSVYTGSGQYTDTNGNGTWSFTDTANLNFNLYGVVYWSSDFRIHVCSLGFA